MADKISLVAILSAQAAGFVKGMKTATSSLKDFSTEIKGGFAFGVMAKAGSSAFSALTSGAQEMIGEINSSVKTWKTFEGNMKNFGKNKKQISAVKKELQSYAETTVYNSSEMASTYAQLEAVGVGSMKSLSKGHKRPCEGVWRPCGCGRRSQPSNEISVTAGDADGGKA